MFSNPLQDAGLFDGYLKIIVATPNDKTDLLIQGLKLHMSELAAEYKGKIEIYNGGLH